ncbi:hypothetical protein Tco_1016085 [Tanacetum coccineum]|uniref:Reverse transcriptase domain-containing protein n=1 Tax=Tanacetum coccineum TaxID=301880 RepID=A0ABQ5FNV9_9ASTR
MLERLAGNEFYCFLDGFSGYFQIPIDPKDQEKTILVPLRNISRTAYAIRFVQLHRELSTLFDGIFLRLIEKRWEVFMDDFSVFGDSFSSCLANLDKMLKGCEDTKLALNWEIAPFHVKSEIVLGHKISRKGIEVDKAKVDVILSFSPKRSHGIRQFSRAMQDSIGDLSKDFLKILTHDLLLENETLFHFFEKYCISSHFKHLKKNIDELQFSLLQIGTNLLKSCAMQVIMQSVQS